MKQIKQNNNWKLHEKIRVKWIELKGCCAHMLLPAHKHSSETCKKTNLSCHAFMYVLWYIIHTFTAYHCNITLITYLNNDEKEKQTRMTKLQYVSEKQCLLSPVDCLCVRLHLPPWGGITHWVTKAIHSWGTVVQLRGTFKLFFENRTFFITDNCKLLSCDFPSCCSESVNFH